MAPVPGQVPEHQRAVQGCQAGARLGIVGPPAGFLQADRGRSLGYYGRRRRQRLPGRAVLPRLGLFGGSPQRLLRVLKDNDFRAERFEYISRIHEVNLRNNDRLVFGAYTSFRDFDLWNAWFRVWALGVGLGDLKLASIYRRYLKSHDDS